MPILNNNKIQSHTPTHYLLKTLLLISFNELQLLIKPLKICPQNVVIIIQCADSLD